MANITHAMPTLHVVSQNAQGLNSPTKRKKILQSLHTQNTDILLLQDTHFPKRYSLSFIHAKFPTFFLANADDKTKGVAILISQSCKFSLLTEYKDPEGQFVLAKGTIDNQIFSLVSYYAPNRGQEHFFQNMFKTLNPLF